MATFSVLSFGFKYGEPYPEADMRIDLRRRIANPRENLPRGATGCDAVVRYAVLGSDQHRKILASFIMRAKKIARKQGHCSVALGCMSGIHRSVAFAIEMAERLTAEGHHASVDHYHLKPCTDA